MTNRVIGAVVFNLASRSQRGLWTILGGSRCTQLYCARFIRVLDGVVGLQWVGAVGRGATQVENHWSRQYGDVVISQLLTWSFFATTICLVTLQRAGALMRRRDCVFFPPHEPTLLTQTPKQSIAMSVSGLGKFGHRTSASSQLLCLADCSKVRRNAVPSPQGAFWGLIPPQTKLQATPNLIMKHHKSLEFLPNLGMSRPLWTYVKPPLLRTLWRNTGTLVDFGER